MIETHYDSAGRVDWQRDELGNTSYFDYTSIAGATKVTDRKGNVGVDYYTFGVLTKVTRGYGTPEEATWLYERHPATLGITKITDPIGHVDRLNGYDAEGNLVETEDALGRTSTFTYNDLHQPLSATVPLTVDNTQTVTTEWTYDAAGNLESVSTPLLDAAGSVVAERTSVYHHDDPGHPEDVTSTTDPDGKVWTYSYDPETGVQTEMTDPLGNTRTFEIDELGRVTAAVAPKGNEPGADPADFRTTFAHNARGQVVLSTNPIGHQTERSFDANGRLSTLEDAEGRLTTHVYDDADRLIEVHRPDSSILKTAYWPDGSLWKQIDGAEAETTYAYDSLGRLTTANDPLGNITTTSYDAAGNVSSREQPGGDCSASPATGCTTYGYDVADQLTSVSYSDPATPDVTDIDYDGLGRRISMTDTTGGASTWAFDSLGRLVQSVTPNGTVGYGWNLRGLLTSIAYPGGAGTVTRSHDDAGRLASVTDWLGRTNTVGHDENANLTAESFANGKSVTFTHDAADRLMGVTHRSGGLTGPTFASFGYERDSNALLTAVDASGVPPDDHSYTYTDLDQLEQVDSPASAYGYDAADNLARLTDGTVQSFNAANELVDSRRLTFVGTAKGGDPGSANGQVTVPFPALAKAGDLVLVSFVIANNAGVVDVPGYTPVAEVENNAANGPRVEVRRRFISAGETSVTVTYPTGAAPLPKAVQVAVYRGVSTSSPVASVSTSTASGTVLTLPSVTGPTAEAHLVAFAGARGHALAAQWSFDSPLTERDEKSDLPLVSLGVADQTLGTAGATGARTARMSASSELAGVSLVLRPALTTFTYERGNRSAVSPSGATGWTYGYDEANRLTSFTKGVTSASYAYRGDGLRLSKTVAGSMTRFVWDESGGLPVLLAEIRPDGSQVSYVNGPGGRVLAQISPSVPISPIAGATATAQDSAGTANQLTATWTTPLLPDDQIIFAATGPNDLTVSGSSGTLVKTIVGGSASTAVFRKTATGGETSVQVTFSNGQTRPKSLAVVAYRGVDPAAPLDSEVPTAADGTGTSPTGGTITVPSLTTGSAGARLVMVAGAAGTAPTSGTWTLPGSMTTRADITVTGRNNRLVIADEPRLTTGATGTRAASYNQPLTGMNGALLALNPAPAPTLWYHHDQLGSTRVLTDNLGRTVATYTYDPYGRPAGSTVAPGRTVTNLRLTPSRGHPILG